NPSRTGASSPRGENGQAVDNLDEAILLVRRATMKSPNFRRGFTSNALFERATKKRFRLNGLKESFGGRHNQYTLSPLPPCRDGDSKVILLVMRCVSSCHDCQRQVIFRARRCSCLCA